MSGFVDALKGLPRFALKNLVVVISLVVIVVSLPLGWIFSQRWNASIREEAQTAGTSRATEVDRQRLTYIVPTVVPGEQDVQLQHPPNQALTEWFAEQRRVRLEENEQVREAARELNSREHGSPINGLFPEMPSDPTQILRALGAVADRLAGDARTPSLYAEMLDSIGAGEPADAVEIAQSLIEERERAVERALAETDDGQLTPELEDQITEALVSRRIGEYRRAATGISVYADVSVFASEAFGMDTAVAPPALEATSRPSIEQGYAWIWDAWVVRDLLDAVARANTGLAGEQTEVEQSVVKRIVEIGLEAHPLSEVAGASGGNDMNMGGDRSPFGGPRGGVPQGTRGPSQPGMGDGSSTLRSVPGGVPTDPAVSVTGRLSSSGNTLYDVRKAKLSVVVESARLPALLDAIAQTNMMTVLEVDLQEVDVFADLSAGYFYGDRHVVLAEITVESLWLRSWTSELMPDSVRQFLGLPARPVG
ncbi:MAG: hypothetical protein AAF747_05185 [Planctomycetota bacterium]